MRGQITLLFRHQFLMTPQVFDQTRAGEALFLRHGSERTVLNRTPNFVKRLHEMEGLCFKGRVFMFEG